jgi:hypothetical protein
MTTLPNQPNGGYLYQPSEPYREIRGNHVDGFQQWTSALEVWGSRSRPRTASDPRPRHSFLGHSIRDGTQREAVMTGNSKVFWDGVRARRAAPRPMRRRKTKPESTLPRKPRFVGPGQFVPEQLFRQTHWPQSDPNTRVRYLPRTQLGVQRRMLQDKNQRWGHLEQHGWDWRAPVETLNSQTTRW